MRTFWECQISSKNLLHNSRFRDLWQGWVFSIDGKTAYPHCRLGFLLLLEKLAYSNHGSALNWVTLDRWVKDNEL